MLVPRSVIPKPECFWDFEGIPLLFTIIWGNSQPAVGQVAMKFAQEFMNQDQKKRKDVLETDSCCISYCFPVNLPIFNFLSISRFCWVLEVVVSAPHAFSGRISEDALRDARVP